ncbi:MAG: hypothetical protein R2864_05670 [Syntrophotaleaceae bacterium]
MASRPWPWFQSSEIDLAVAALPDRYQGQLQFFHHQYAAAVHRPLQNAVTCPCRAASSTCRVPWYPSAAYRADASTNG